MNNQSQPNMAPAWDSFRLRDPFSIGGLLIVFAVIASTGTPRELAIAVFFLLVAGVVPAPLAFVAGQLAVAPTITLEETLLFGVTQLALLCVLTEPARRQQRWSTLAGTLLAFGLLVAVVAIGLRDGLVVAGGLLCVTVAAGTYLARRVTLVRLGRVAERVTQSADEAGATETTPTASTTESGVKTAVSDGSPATESRPSGGETDSIQSDPQTADDNGEPKE